MPAWRPHACALALYLLLALAFTWPLPVHLSTHLTGPIGGDTGVYVWNQWVFRHELVEHRSLPYFTGKIFSLASRANLSLHNYTTFANLIALPLMEPLGVVATFNVVYLVMTVASAYAMFLLARRVTGSGATLGSNLPAILAGLLFAWSPVLVTRGGGHFSLVAAAPLPIFVLALLRAEGRWQLRDAAMLGGVMAWAATSDVYYAVFCLLLAAAYLGVRLVCIHRAEPARRLALLSRAIDIVIVSVAGLIVALVISRGWRLTFLGATISMRGLYTPVLVMTMLVGVRVALWHRPALVELDRIAVLRALRVGALVAAVAMVLLSPVLYALGQRVVEDGMPASRPFWRSGPRGVDVVALVLPNPNHPLSPAAAQQWLTPRPDAYLENVASIPLTAVAAIWLAWRTGWRLPRLWVVISTLFGLLALGPFVHVAGVNTYVPAPWALLRYLPIIGLARMPARFSIVLVLGVSVLFALALRAICARYPRHRLALLAGAAFLLVAELLPVPRPLYEASVPAFYSRIAADPREDVRVLELPFGIRDGTMSVGNFTARSQFYQTTHRKPLIGGYLSRVSRKRAEEVWQSRTLSALVTLSEGRTLPETAAVALEQRAPSFARRARLGYVVIDRARASQSLTELAVRAFRLELVAQEGPLELYRPVL